MQRLPGQRRIERRVKELLDPGRIEVFGLAVPCIAQRPEAPLGPLWPRRLGGAHGDFARDRAALARRELGVPHAGGRRGDFGEPEIGRTTVALARFGRDASVRRDQRKLALERLLHGEDDAQRRALPWHERRRQDRELGRVLAAADLTFSPRLHDREKEDETCARDQQPCCHSGGKAACLEQLSPLGSPGPNSTISRKALAESWQKPSPAEFDRPSPTQTLGRRKHYFTRPIR